MNKILTSLLVLPLLVISQSYAAEATAVAPVAAKDTLAVVLAKASNIAVYCANGIKQGAVYVGGKATVLAGAAWEKMPTTMKEKLTYAWQKTTQTTSGKIASATVATAVVVTAIYKFSNQLVKTRTAATH